MTWKIELPPVAPQPERPPYNAGDYPAGTRMTKDGIVWANEWDTQDHRLMWVLQKGQS